MRIQDQRFNFRTGKIEKEKQVLKLSNFSSGEANAFFRKYLIDNGYKDKIGQETKNTKKFGLTQYLTLFNVPIKVKFCVWKANVDTEGGKAVFWVGEKGIKAEPQDTVVNDRVIRKECDWFCLIIVPKDFKEGMSVKSIDFIDYLLIPSTDVIEDIKNTGQPFMKLRKEHREKYEFSKMIGALVNEA